MSEQAKDDLGCLFIVAVIIMVLIILFGVVSGPIPL